MKALAVKVRQHSIFSALSEQGKLSAFRETPWNNHLGFNQLLRTLESVLQNYHEYDCVGLCAEEISCANKPKLVLSPRDIPGKIKYPLRNMVEDFTKRPVRMEHDANAFAVGEANFGAGIGMDVVLCVKFGSHITSGIVDQGELYQGASRQAGNIGHISLYADGHTCECGRQGCFERYASTKELVNRANTADAAIQNGIDLMVEVNNGNPAISHILKQWMSDVVRGLVNAVYFLDPQGLVLGGGIFRERYIFETVKTELHRSLPQYRVQVVQAELGSRAALKGVAYLAINEFNQRKVKQ